MLLCRWMGGGVSLRDPGRAPGHSWKDSGCWSPGTPILPWECQLVHSLVVAFGQACLPRTMPVPAHHPALTPREMVCGFRRGLHAVRYRAGRGQRTLVHPALSLGFPGSSAGKESACNARDPGSIPGLGRDRLPTPVYLGFPCGSAGRESACNAGDLGLILVGKIPWRRERLPTPVF